MVSTVGLLSGIAVAGIPRSTILLTGIVLIFVEAFSMAAGSFLSERSAEEYIKRGDVPASKPLISGIIMFLSYFVSGFVPLFPYLLFSVNQAFVISVLFSLICLFILGLLGAKISRIDIIRRGLRMFIIGGVAIGLGIAAAKISTVFNINSI